MLHWPPIYTDTMSMFGRLLCSGDMTPVALVPLKTEAVKEAGVSVLITPSSTLDKLRDEGLLREDIPQDNGHERQDPSKMVNKLNGVELLPVRDIWDLALAGLSTAREGASLGEWLLLLSDAHLGKYRAV